MSHWPITLSDAILIVLMDAPDHTASTDYIAEEINRRRLYIQKQGTPVFAEQIFLRARKDGEFFELSDRQTVKSLFAGKRRAAKSR